MELGPEAGRPHQAACSDQIVIEHREPGDHLLPQFLDELSTGQGAVAPERAHEADLVVFDPRLGQLFQNEGNDRRDAGRPGHVVEYDADFPFPLAASLMGSEPMG